MEIIMKKHSLLILGLSLFFILCGGGLYFALQVMVPFIGIVLGLGSIGLIYFFIAEKSMVFDFFSLKTTQKGLNMGSVFLLVFLIISLVNYFSVKFVKVFDFSMTSQYTLSDQSKKVIESLNDDLQIKFFYKDGLQNIDSTKKSFLAQAQVFKTFSPRVLISSHEINADPELSQKFSANKGTGEGFISYKGKINRIESQFTSSQGEVYTEQSFINAIIKATREKTKNIYFLTGHGELDSDNDKLEKGFSYFRTALIKNSYKAESLNVITSGQIPPDTDLLVIAGGTQEFQKNELEILNNYIQSGKPLLIFLEHNVSQTLRNIIAQAGWSLGTDFVYNLLNSPQGPVIATDQATVVNQFSAEYEMTKAFNNQQSVIFFRPHPLISSSGVPTQVVLKTSDQAVSLAETATKNYKGVPTSFNMIVHWAGPWKGSPPFSSKLSQMMIVSDVSLAWNQFFYQANNKDLLINIVSFLANENDLISVGLKEPYKTSLKVLGPEFNTYFRFIILGLFFPLPFLFLVFTVVVWYRQRHA
jgi:ABC-type uncharacterized transport system involved in gliding motility auxiliary subunit